MKDPILTTLVNLVENGQMGGAKVSLLVRGATLFGTIISQKQYAERIAGCHQAYGYEGHLNPEARLEIEAQAGLETTSFLHLKEATTHRDHPEMTWRIRIDDISAFQVG